MTDQIEVTYIDHMGSDLSVVNAARVSFGKKSDWEVDKEKRSAHLSEKDTKLIKYLASHKHMSPFGHAFASFHVKAPLFVARQLVKHQYLRWNEVSRRYVDDEPEFYTPEVWRGRSENKKQGSGEPLSSEQLSILGNIEDFHTGMVEFYKEIMNLGVCPEQARMVLPQSMMTEWYWSGSLDAFAGMCNLRLKEDTQYESRLVAQQIDDKMKELFPVSWGELVKGQKRRCLTKHGM